MPDDNALVVASIAEHPRRRGRFVVFVADEAIATVTADAIAELQIRVGAAMSQQTLDALRVHDRRTGILDRALRLLAVRARSTAELSRTLMRAKERPLPEDVKWVQQALSNQGYLDDARFAEQFVRDRASTRGWGKQRLTRELRRRGIPQAHIDPAMAQASEDAVLDDARSASAVAFKWRRTHAARDPNRDRQRLYGFLARRGFSPDVIRAAMREALDERDSDSP